MTHVNKKNNSELKIIAEISVQVPTVCYVCKTWHIFNDNWDDVSHSSTGQTRYCFAREVPIRLVQSYRKPSFTSENPLVWTSSVYSSHYLYYLFYSKHKCPTHHNITSIVDTSLNFDGSTTHQLAYAAQDRQPRRRGLAIPPVTLPQISRVLDVTSVHRQDYVTHPCGKRTSCKRDNKRDLTVPVTSFNHVTSYNQDFPPRPLAVSRAPQKPKQDTAPYFVDPSRRIYTTTNNEMLQKWGPFERAQIFGDPPSQLAFEGEFLGRSVAREDFNSDVLREGRPSTTFKKTNASDKQNERFDDSTTNKTAFPAVPRDQQVMPTLFSKRRSQKHAETMAPPTSTEECIAQLEKGYRIGCHQMQPQEKRGLCIPHPDMLKLFEGAIETTSEHADSYKRWSDALPAKKLNRTEDSFKNEDRGKSFDETTSSMLSYVPIHPATIAQGCQDANAMAASNSRFDRDGVQMKEAQDFGEPIQKSTVTGSDYFRFWNVTPRHRYGDRYESVRNESRAGCMEGSSEMKMSFVPHSGVQPAQSFKPAVLQPISSFAPSRMSNSTEYKNEYTKKPIAANICPAFLILHKQS